jgi:hypothetical protein
MDDYIIQANIRRFSELLKTCADQVRRETIERLLASEKDKLAGDEQRPLDESPTALPTEPNQGRRALKLRQARSV